MRFCFKLFDTPFWPVLKNDFGGQSARGQLSSGFWIYFCVCHISHTCELRHDVKRYWGVRFSKRFLCPNRFHYQFIFTQRNDKVQIHIFSKRPSDDSFIRKRNFWRRAWCTRIMNVMIWKACSRFYQHQFQPFNTLTMPLETVCWAHQTTYISTNIESSSEDRLQKLRQYRNVR